MLGKPVKKSATKLGKSGDVKQRTEAINRIVSMARGDRDTRLAGYREKSLAKHPLVCARCAREFVRENLSELTVHHKDHNHDNNPEDGSNWENLCIYCHDNEHARHLEYLNAGEPLGVQDEPSGATHNPFAGLKEMLAKK